MFRSGEWKEIEWKDLKEGDIVKIVDLEYFPADIALIASSDEKGTAYIMTSSLDGEKNLKPKFAKIET